MRQILWICGYLALPLLSICASQVENEVFESLLAPCCWHESLAVHRSETASNLRMEITQMASTGMSAEQIRAKMTQRYGVRILREPPGERARWLYALPLISLFLGLTAVFYFLRKHLQRRTRAVVIPEGVTLPDIDLD
ncbi:MAG: cytochrome c-type biogenesis protein CcmH [Acidobacteria bacterium]|nr:cytochrome c-type biogenesis protein CcmH [Acidobacteriota bacterium]